MSEAANKLRLVGDRLVMADGSDATEYLRAFAESRGITPDTPVNLMMRSDLQRLHMESEGWCSCRSPDERFALVA